MSAVMREVEYVEIDHEDTFYWQATQPIGSPDVDLVIGSLIGNWDDDERALAMRAIGRKLQWTAEALLGEES